MSKTFSAGLAAHYAGRQFSLAQCLKVTRLDGAVYGLTSAPKDVTNDGVTYLSNPGLVIQNLRFSSGGQVPNTEIMFLPDGVLLIRADFLSGLWNSAAFELFELDYMDPADGVNPLLSGTLGEVRPNRDGFVCELRGLAQKLQQPVGEVTTKNCRAVLGDSRCKVNLAPFTFSGTVTTAGQQTFTDSALAQAADYFNEGTVTWLTGDNEGLQAKVKAHATGGVITLTLPMIKTVQVGDTFGIVAGCQKRLTEDCKTKFNNVINFQGEPHLRGNDQLIAPVEPNV